MKKLLLTLAAFAALVQPALSQDKWPSRPIKFIVPYAAGGNTDAVSRIAANHLQKLLGVSIVIENRGGAGGIVGTDAVDQKNAEILLASPELACGYQRDGFVDLRGAKRAGL